MWTLRVTGSYIFVMNDRYQGFARTPLGQLLVKLRRKIRKGVLIVHSQPALIGALTGSGLKVARSVSVERSRNGTELVIYLLEKTSPR